MKAILFQIEFCWDAEGAERSFSRTIETLRSLNKKADVIVLPESADVPYAPATREEYEAFASAHTGMLLHVAAETAERLSAVVFVNASDCVDGVYANTTFVFDRQGQLAGKYLKQHLTPGEITKLHLNSGYTYEYNEPMTIELDGVRYAFLTCYDFYFYEMYSHIAQKRPHVIIGCAQQRSDTHATAGIYARFLAYVTGAYVLRSGVSMGEDSSVGGSSMAVAPDGTVLAEFENEVGIKEIEFDPFSKYLKPMGFGNPVGLHHDYTEKGRRPWKYRAAGSAIVPDDSTMPYPRLCAHRGFSTVAPENSMPAFGAALALGAQEIEFDLWATKDNEIVSIHDDTLERVSDGEGKVYEKTLEELKKLDFGSKFSRAYAGLRIVKFEDILKKFAGHCIMNVHIKTVDIHKPLPEEELRKIIGLIDKYDNRRYVYFMTENNSVQLQLARLAPDIARCVGENDRHYEIVNRAIALGAQKVQLFKPYFNEEMIAKAKENGIRMTVFFADDPEEAQKYLDMGIDCVLTNDYLKIKNALNI